MKKRRSAINLLAGKDVSDMSLIVNQAIIDLLIEKELLTEEEIQTRITELRSSAYKKDSYRSKF
jgi:hypothetical protein